jgi:hypothetical protein
MIKDTSRRARHAALLGVCGGLALASGGCSGRTTDGTGTGSGPYSGGTATVTTSGDDGGFPPLPTTEEDAGFPGPLGGGCGPQMPVPNFGTPVTCATPPPPISGGTLIITKDGTKAIVADPDRDAIYVVDLTTNTVLFTISLQPGDEPGRLAEDGQGHVHVALRGRGVLVSFDPSSGNILQQRPVCPAPRGVGYQASNDTLWVACATGELVSLPASGGAATGSQHIDRDLRDVVVQGDSIAVTQFRAAQVLRLGANQAVTRTDPLPSSLSGFVSHVAWRAIAGANGSIVSVHQAESTTSISTKQPGGYGCAGGGGGSLPPVATPPSLPGIAVDVGASAGNAVNAVLTVIGSDGSVTANLPFGGVLPVDVAASPDGTLFAAVAAGAGSGSAQTPDVFLFNVTSELSAYTVGNGGAIALAFVSDNELVVQTREPSALWVVPVNASSDAGGNYVSIPLGSSSRQDTGHDIFHTHAGSPLACASCHPEGGDDGHVWLLDGNQRRTPSLRGTIAGTAPYHWPGDEKDFQSIVSDVYVVRMNGPMLDSDQTTALNAWVNAVPAPPAPTWVDPNAAAAGKAIFNRTDVGCATCHSGAKFTNNTTVDVGTGGAFQVPPLVGVGWRTPLLHDGCATTLTDRFSSACNTSLHGNTSSLSSQDIANLVAYLETL